MSFILYNITIFGHLDSSIVYAQKNPVNAHDGVSGWVRVFNLGPSLHLFHALCMRDATVLLKNLMCCHI